MCMVSFFRPKILNNRPLQMIKGHIFVALNHVNVSRRSKRSFLIALIVALSCENT